MALQWGILSEMKCFHFWHCLGFIWSLFNYLPWFRVNLGGKHHKVTLGHHQKQILCASIHTITGKLYCQPSFLWD